MQRLLTVVASLVGEHRLQGMKASVVSGCGRSSCGSWSLEHRLNSFGSRAQLLHSMYNLPRSGIEPMSPVLVGYSFPLSHQRSLNLSQLLIYLFLNFIVCELNTLLFSEYIICRETCRQKVLKAGANALF